MGPMDSSRGMFLVHQKLMQHSVISCEPACISRKQTWWYEQSWSCCWRLLHSLYLIILSMAGWTVEHAAINHLPRHYEDSLLHTSYVCSHNKHSLPNQLAHMQLLVIWHWSWVGLICVAHFFSLEKIISQLLISQLCSHRHVSRLRKQTITHTHTHTQFLWKSNLRKSRFL